MPVRVQAPDLVRVVEGKRGQVRMRMELVIRFDYGSIIPWVQQIDGGISAIAGPDRLLLITPVPLHGEGFTTTADFLVSAGQRENFTLIWHPSHEEMPTPIDPWWAIRGTEHWWQEWSSRCTYRGEWRDAVMRSLITLKALTYAPTGGIVAAPTTSLPEHIGGVRNWDYRYCWLRDATFTLFALLNTGYLDEARAWRSWLMRSIAGRPAETQIMYGLAGERRLTEMELPWLSGYEGSRPVRVGNAASQQFQLDVYGEVLDALYHARVLGLESDAGRLVDWAGPAGICGVGLAAARRRNLGGARSAPPLHAFQGHGLGRDGSGRQGDGSASDWRGHWTDGGRSATTSTLRS